MPPVPAASIQLPDRYRVLRHVANGGMASVWEAHDELLGRDVAVKVLAAHLTQDDTARVRFQREARAAAGLSGHPHIVTIYDIGEHAGRSFIVMEMMRRSLAELLVRDEPIPSDQSLRWLREAASGLDAAHEARIVHRDVKPANMLLDSRDRLALGDFGIARLAYETQVTATGTLLGTSSYISPEQALGEPATAASDRYALAVVAFQMLTGGKPFRAEHFAAQARAHIEDPPPSASERRPELGTGADAALQRGMAKDPAARWATAREFVDELQRGIGRSAPAAAGVAIPAPAPTRVVSDEPAGDAPSEERPARTTVVAGGRDAPSPKDPPRRRAAPPQPPQRRWGVVALVAGLLLLAGVATAVALMAGGGESPSPRAERPEPTPTPTPTEEPTPDATREPTPEATPEPTPEATPEPTPEATPESTPNPTPAPDAGGGAPDPAAAAPLNNEGFSLNRAGRYQEALQPLSQAHALCRGSGQLDPCGFAAYNYAVALNRSGDPDAAVPILEERLARFGDNNDGDVARELREARRAARNNS